MKIPTAAMAMILLTGGCTTASGGAPSDPPVTGSASTPSSDVAGVRDGEVRLHVGQGLSIALPSNGTTGYRWQVTGMEQGVLAPGIPFGQEAVDPHPPGMVGVGGVTRWRFIAAEPGSVTLTFAYGRSWERGTPPAETAVYRIVVR